MPLYSIKLTVPPGTPENVPVKGEILLREKLITMLEVIGDSGCGLEVGVRIQYGIKRFFPENPDVWMWMSGWPIKWDERLEMPAVNEKLTIYVCSPNALYEHDVVVTVVTLPAGFYFLEKLIDTLRKLWEKLV